jgi:hypothetical protein
MKLKFLSILIFLLSTGIKTFASQPGNFTLTDSIGKVSQTKFIKTIWLNVGQLAFERELQLGFEKQINPKISLEGTLGYKYAVQEGQEYELCAGCMTGLPNYYDNVARIPFSNGLLASIALKAYVKNAPGFYFSPQVFYRYWFYNHQLLSSYGHLSEAEDNFESQQSLRMHVVGLKLLTGYSFPIISFSPKHKLVADIYTGLGFRQKFATTKFDWFHDSRQNSGTYYRTPPYTSSEKSNIISLQLGAKLGFMF